VTGAAREPLLRPHGGWAALGVAAAVVGAGLRVAIVPLFVTPVFDRVLAAGALHELPRWLAAGGAIAFAGAALLYLQDVAFGRAAAHRARVWRARLHDALLRRPPGAAGDPSSGGLATRVLSDLREVETYILYGLGSLVAESATLVAILAVLTLTDATATAGLLLLVLPAVVATRAIGRSVEGAARDHQATIEEVGARLQEHVRQRETLRAFGAFGFAARRFAPVDAAVERALARRTRWAALPTPVAQLLVFAAVGGLVAWLARGVALGSTTTGELVGFVTLVALLATPAQLLPKSLALWQQARAAAARLRALDAGFVAAPGRPGGAADARATTGAAAGATSEVGAAALRSTALVVGFPGGATLAADDVALGARGLVVVAGPSGAGKTSWLRTVLGLLPPLAGRLEVAGVAVDPNGVADETALRARVGYVPQGAALLSGSLRDNLALGRDLPDAVLRSALEDVGLGATVAALPAGLGTELAEDGAGLSGGQQQRLAIARALVGRPHLLLLDEPTSALDDAAEADLIALLRRLADERTVVAVSHRAPLAAVADRVLRAIDGRLVDGGGAS
jgi:ATP-binding cassette, subfamily B, bacterial